MSKDFTYIDIHGHLNFVAYDAAGPGQLADREDAIKREQEAGVTGMTALGGGVETHVSFA